MTSPETDAKKPRKRFTTTHPELDLLFQEIDAEIRSKNLLKFYTYHFNETTKTHELVVDQKYKFTKKEGSVAVFEEELIYPSQSKDTSWSNNHDQMPYMWPISKSMNAYPDMVFSGIVGEVVYKKFREFREKNKGFVEKMKPKEWNKRAYQIETVIRQTWSRRNKRYRQKSLFACTKIWWDMFVDRELLKTCVAVAGVSSRKAISYKTYANISSQPNLTEIVEHVKNMGAEKALLDIHAPEKWINLGHHNLISPLWKSVWSSVNKEPKSIQRVIVFSSRVHAYWVSDGDDIEFSAPAPLPRPQPKKPMYVWEEENQKPLSWVLYEQLTAGAKIPPRQKQMLLVASFVLEDFYSSQNYRIESGVQKEKFPTLPELLQSNDVGKICKDLALLWKDTHKKEYASWSHGHTSNWRHFVEEVLLYSLPENKVAFPPGRTYDSYRALWDKKMLDAALLGVKKGKTQPKRRI